MSTRTGLLGGTFDPVHYGHLAIAEDARVALGLEQIVFIPAAQQPFKRNKEVAAGVHRLAMLQQACAGNPAFVVSPIELERDGVSYTATTLEQLRAQGFEDLFFILGADALNDLPRWHRAVDIPALAQIVGVKRPGEEVDLAPLYLELPTLRGRLTVLEGPQLNLSSTELRRRVRENASLRYLTPDSVVAYIEQAQLYQQLSNV